ncbi:MAG: hypothetical protein F4Z31_18915 [Gemmatimonadetes bacterium]|nr:hypothetical protein [Gemmatimonadota bacterium]MYA43803.1 hypothetical protein [Gemmatimonadota bacterium]MYE93053.1 hypothetical protein [Gemmatimonadota bacterium]
MRGRTPGNDGAEGDRSALARALAVQERASGLGFDWQEPAGALEKVFEEAGEVADLVAAAARGVPDHTATQAELGDLLFAVVNLARLAQVDPARALDQATGKFVTRFREVERLARARGLPLPGTSLERLDGIWDEVKRRERGSGGPG